MIPDDSAVSRKIDKLIAREACKQEHGMVPLYEENGVYNFYVEMKRPGTGVEIEAPGGGWRTSQAHPWKEVGAFSKTPVWQQIRRAMGWTEKELEARVMRLASELQGFPRQPKA